MTGQRTRFAPSRWSTAWHAVVKRISPPTHPSTTSDSAFGSNARSNDAYQDSVRQHYPVELVASSSRPHRRPWKLSSNPTNRKSSHQSTSRYGDDEEPPSGRSDPVVHVVVDNNFEHFTPRPPTSESGVSGHTPGQTSRSGRGGGADSGKDLLDDDEGGSQRSEVASLSQERTGHANPWWERNKASLWVVERLWPNIWHFFESSFPEPAKERSFQKEAWFTQKQGAVACSLLFLISWTLSTGLQPPPLTQFAWIAYFGVGGFFTLPLIPMVIFDIPRRAKWIWQPMLLGAAWVLADVLLVEMMTCGFFTDNPDCGGKNFLNTLGFAYGQPVLAILALRQNRFFHALGAIQWVVLSGAGLLTQSEAPTLFYRNIVNFALFHFFLIGASFLKERSDRQMFALRQQLKIQYRATQSAQVLERRAADSKKRFVSYIFHEVRVPLNTALLAVQNLEGEKVFAGLHEDQADMVHGLMGSLTMMEKVLNDVLSFNRMESGKFAQARKPFEFHKSIQLVALSHRMQAQMAGIELIVELDPHIDRIGGMFVGDEMRLRQVASIKFTDKGSVRIVTKLLYPRLEPTPAVEMDDPLNIAAANRGAAERDTATLHDHEKGGVAMSRDETVPQSRDSAALPRIFKAVVRVEVHDTGVGLKKQDVIDNRLFSPYVQTEIGRRQGGKGSGLGLALVRQIVKLSNGRLGVESEFGKGSMFWFELPYSLPPPPKTTGTPHLSTHTPRSPQSLRIAMIPTGLAVPSVIPRPPQGQLRRISSELPSPSSETPPRPELRAANSMTESRLPLLPLRRGHTRERSVPPEEVIQATYPPVEGSPEDETPPAVHEIDFVPHALRPDTERRSSEFTGGDSGATLVADAPSIPPASPLESDVLCTLVVDDDRLTRMLMSRMLTRLGHQVSTAENGKIALEMIRDSFERKPSAPRFDIVFLDNQMPMMSGVEVAREVREMGCPIFIVGCTGNALREDQDEYIAAGADDIIPKPIHQRSVVDMIREARRRVAGETSPRDLGGASSYRRGSVPESDGDGRGERLGSTSSAMWRDSGGDGGDLV